MTLLWKLLRSHLSVAQTLGFALAGLVGMTVVLTALQAYRDVLPVFEGPDSFAEGDYLVLSKRVGTLKGWHRARTKPPRCRWPNESSPTGVSRLSAIPAAPSSPSIPLRGLEMRQVVFSAQCSPPRSAPRRAAGPGTAGSAT